MDVLFKQKRLNRKRKLFKIFSLAFLSMVFSSAVSAFLTNTREVFGDGIANILIILFVIVCFIELILVLCAITSSKKYKKFMLENAESIKFANEVKDNPVEHKEESEQVKQEEVEPKQEEALENKNELVVETPVEDKQEEIEVTLGEEKSEPVVKMPLKHVEKNGLLKSILMKVIAPFCDGGSTLVITLPSIIKMLLGTTTISAIFSNGKVDLKVPSIISSFLSGKPILVYKGEQQIGKIEKKSIISMILSKTKVSVYKADNKVIEIDLPRLLFVAIFKSTYVINNIEEGYQKTIQTPSPIKMIISGTEITIK